MRNRAGVYSRYAQEQAIFNTNTKRFWFVALMVFAVWMPFVAGRDWVLIGANICAAAIGAIGLNLVSGYAGQISLGHAFFLGVGAFTGIVLASPSGARLTGFGIDQIWIWLPAAGLVAALIGGLIAPIAVRLRGLYLAIVTVGLVLVGEHIFREARNLTGGVGTGRGGPSPKIGDFRFDRPEAIGNLQLTRGQGLYFLSLIVLVILAFLAKNLVRSRTGRAFMAVRDRDIAASVMGINLTRIKIIAFTVSSFYAGIAGALLATNTGFVEPSGYNLLLSIQFVAMIIIGGIGSIAGSIMGAAFIMALPHLVQDLSDLLPFISLSPVGAFPTAFEAERMLYGGLLIGFILLEPRGLYGIWIRIRNYFRAWPFSY
jgi:branched-chain amino acid transport system permease protein